MPPNLIREVMQEQHAVTDGNKSAKEQSSAFVSEIPDIQRKVLQKRIDQCQVQQHAVTSMPTRTPPTTKPSNQVKFLKKINHKKTKYNYSVCERGTHTCIHSCEVIIKQALKFCTLTLTWSM